MASAPDTARCPLCGKPNQCALAGAREPGSPPPACWCASERFPAELRARAPTGSACICRECLRAAEAERDAP